MNSRPQFFSGLKSDGKPSRYHQSKCKPAAHTLIPKALPTVPHRCFTPLDSVWPTELVALSNSNSKLSSSHSPKTRKKNEAKPYYPPLPDPLKTKVKTEEDTMQRLNKFEQQMALKRQNDRDEAGAPPATALTIFGSMISGLSKITPQQLDLATLAFNQDTVAATQATKSAAYALRVLKLSHMTQQEYSTNNCCASPECNNMIYNSFNQMYRAEMQLAEAGKHPRRQAERRASKEGEGGGGVDREK